MSVCGPIRVQPSLISCRLIRARDFPSPSEPKNVRLANRKQNSALLRSPAVGPGGRYPPLEQLTKGTLRYWEHDGCIAPIRSSAYKNTCQKSGRSFPPEIQYHHVVACGRVAQLGEHLHCKKAGKIKQVPHLVSLMREHSVQPRSLIGLQLDRNSAETRRTIPESSCARSTQNFKSSDFPGDSWWFRAADGDSSGR